MVTTSAETFLNLVSVLGVCTSEDCERSAFMFSKNMNTDFHPCENFYTYACGNFRNLHPRPPWRWNIKYLNLRRQSIQTKVLRFLRFADLGPFPNIRTLYGMYTQCMDEEPYGLEAIAQQLQNVGLPPIPPFHALAPALLDESTVLARIHRYSPATIFLFDINIKPNPRDVRGNHIYFGHAPSASNAPVSASDKADSEFEATKPEIRQALQKCILSTVNFMYENLGTALGPEQIILKNTLVEEVTDFLLELDKAVHIDRYTFFDELQFMPYQSFQPWTNNILQNGRIRINWDRYFDVLFENITRPRENLNLGNWKYIMIQSTDQMQHILRTLQKTSKEVFICTMWFLTVRSMNDFAPKALQDINDEYVRTVFKIEIMPRDIKKQEACSEFLASISSKVAGYVLAIYENGLKNRDLVIWMVEAIRNGLEDNIREARWLDEATRAEAIKKLKNITSFVGIRNEDLNIQAIENSYKGMTVESSHYLTHLKGIQNGRESQLRNIQTQNSFEARSKISANPQTVQASYSQQYLHLSISLGILGFPFYYLGLNVLHFAAIGSQIGHEFGHAYEEEGRIYNSAGQFGLWQSNKSSEEYLKKRKCFQESYGNFFFNSIKKHANGYSTLSENIADSIGFAAALRAYRNIVAKFGMEQLLVNFETFTHEQLFTLAFANIWCQNASPQHILDMIENDEHSPSAVRVNGVMMNSKEFSKIWNCPEGAPMNPKIKCEIFS